MNADIRGRRSDRPEERRISGVLGALARDTAGNTLAMMAAFLVPLAALAGSAVDMSRAYVVRVRLQQACDAGVLAGRKLMTVTSGTALDPSGTTTAKDAADAFFKNNFPSGFMSTTPLTASSFTATRTTDGQVSGSATVTMPMAIMRMFGFGSMTQTVTCTARLDIGDSDIMFVLDTTGSMGCDTGSGCSSTATYTRADGTTGYQIVEETGSKIQALREAVALFYTTLDANKPAAAHIRYGFVPYSSSVNVGRLIYDLNPSYLVNNWTYQSREWATGGTVTGGIPSDVTNGTSSNATTLNITTSACDALAVRSPSAGYNTDGRATVKTKVSWTANSTGSTNGSCVIASQPVKVNWTYKPVSYDVSTFKTFASVTDPSKVTGATTKWQGCIEERGTTASTSFSASSLPSDLDADLVPTNDATRWRPAWPNVVYYRAGTASTTNSGASTSVYGDTTNSNAGDNFTPVLGGTSSAGSLGPVTQYWACGKAAQRLQEMTAAQVDTYVAASGDFRPFGHTYHDIGMLWGLRLLSPTGLWASDTAAWPGNNAPNRFIVFMTDGVMDPDLNSYEVYGMEKLDQRVTGGTTANDDANHNARLLAACNAARAKNITVFVVAFDVGSTVPTTLQNCATPGYAYAATTQAALRTAFSTIALQVAKLRLSQ
jgi:Flp pilus assembly protein TadG